MIERWKKLSSRKKKIIYIQSSLLISGLLIIVFTFLKFDRNPSNEIFSKEVKKEIDKKINKESSETGNIFYNIEYSGVDLSGNRYILRAREAKNEQNIEGLLSLKSVKAFFYFKNNKTLNIVSDEGLYNNKTLDMTFKKNVEGKYEESTLIAQKAEYFNSKNLLIITENVKIRDFRGTMMAEKLIFDIEKNTLNISSSENEKVNANLNYK
tara:strand:- start:1416 stop:2045 length:630 start_codon:yes stop_codon:yes gene_type:complete